MFFNIFKNQLKLGFRNKSNVFWTLMFPLILGTLFKITFGNIYSEYTSDAIKTAVVFETDDEDIRNNTKAYLEGLTMNDHKMLDISYMDYESAEALLKDDEQVNGIISVKNDGRLSLDIISNGVLSTIQETITTIYNQNVGLIEMVAAEHPENLPAVLEGIQKRAEYIDTHNLAGDNKDPFVSYFYNLIAMTALFAALTSLRIGNNCQANMSSLGARTNASPLSRMTFQAAAFLAAYIVQTAIIFVGITYMLFGIKINFGGDIPLVYFTTAIASLLGTSLGFAVGNLGSFNLDKKESILVGLTLTGCALSGLMYGDMKVIITEKAPIINKINPAAVISDSYYCLNMFGVGSRYLMTLLYMLVISAVLITLGLVMGRRNHYDSI
ncbi:MAG: ABC transporter permease [Lachnospiraceae bacterium]|nr:ABC transporter permease [Lachnospiraceae bacterium]